MARGTELDQLMMADLGSRRGTLKRAVLLDGAALCLFLAYTAVTHAKFVPIGLSWVDATWYFHFGQRLLHEGAVPYRDYIFQVGPLPIYVDALYQRLLGEHYTASVWAGLTINTLRVFVAYLIARRFVGRPAALLLGLFFAIDGMFGFQHHWSVAYAQLFGSVTALFIVCAYHRPDRKRIFLGCAGLALAMVFTARQSQGTVATAMLVACTVGMRLRCPEWMDTRSALALWAGFVFGLGLFALALASQHALGPALQQLFVDAPAKKAVHGIDPFLDAISGGGLVYYKGDPLFTRLTGFLVFNGAPLVIVVAVLAWLWRGPRQLAGGLLVAVVPALVFVAALSRVMQLHLTADLPRIFAVSVLVLTFLAPERAGRVLGIEAPEVFGLVAVPIAMDIAMEMSHSGRGWGDGPGLSILAMLLGLASRRIGRSPKLVACTLLPIIGGINSWMLYELGISPFMKGDYQDGPLSGQHFTIEHPLFKDIVMPESKARLLTWLRERVRPNDTCFVYGNSPILYDVLECRNPSALDITVADFYTAQDGENAVAAMHSSPPTWIIAAETHWMSPDLAIPYTGNDDLYGGLNPPASKALHIGLRELINRYDVVGETGDGLRDRPDLVAQAELLRERPHRYRLYRRRE